MFRHRGGTPPTTGQDIAESEKQASQETTVSDNSDAKDLVSGRGASGHRNRVPHDLEIGATSEGIDPMLAAGATSARLAQVRAL